MFTVQVIGNLGSDARKVVENGSEFISFNVAHTDKFSDRAGHVVETTEWISCTINGNREHLLPYLVKGAKVFVSGRAQTRMYSSPKLRQMVAGVKCFVDRIELVGGSTDEVPRHLVSPEGEVFDVFKCFYVLAENAKKAGATKQKRGLLHSERGTSYECDHFGYIHTINQNDGENTQETTASQDNETF